jgi:hypothetical protein
LSDGFATLVLGFSKLRAWRNFDKTLTVRYHFKVLATLFKGILFDPKNNHFLGFEKEMSLTFWGLAGS